MEAEKKKTDYWQVVFSATGVGVMPAMIKQIREILPFAINGTAIAAFTGAIGALLGFGIIYFKDWHYEVALFLPTTKDFSEEFLNKVIESIAVEE